MSTVHGAFVSSDEQDVQVMLREVNELRRARGLQQTEPWWHVQRRDLLPRRRFLRARPGRFTDFCVSKLAGIRTLR